MARALAAALVVSLLAVSGAGGAGAQTPKRGGTVVTAAIGGEPACLNLYVPACEAGNLVSFMDHLPSAVLLGAFEIGPGLTWRPKLVSHVDLTRRPPFTLTYHIRPETRWSDAESLTEILRTDLERIHNVRAVDEKTVRVELAVRFAAWRRLFSALLPRHALRGESFLAAWKDRIDDPRTGRPIGSGPFLVQSWERGRRLTLVRNPRYWGPHRAYLDRLVFRFDFRRRVRTIELLQAQLRRIGVEVRPSFATAAVLFNQILPSGNFDLMTYALVGAPPDEFGAVRWGCGGAVNFRGYCQRLVTADLSQADRILDAGQRADVLNRADLRLARDVPVIPLYWSPTVAVVRSPLQGFVLHPNDPFWRPENWWLER